MSSITPGWQPNGRWSAPCVRHASGGSPADISARFFPGTPCRCTRQSISSRSASIRSRRLGRSAWWVWFRSPARWRSVRCRIASVAKECGRVGRSGFAICYVALIALEGNPSHTLLYVMVLSQGVLGYALTAVMGPIVTEIFEGPHFWRDLWDHHDCAAGRRRGRALGDGRRARSDGQLSARFRDGGGLLRLLRARRVVCGSSQGAAGAGPRPISARLDGDGSKFYLAGGAWGLTFTVVRGKRWLCMAKLVTTPLLRPFRSADAGEFARLSGDWAVASMTSDIPYPFSPSQARRLAQAGARRGALRHRAGRQAIGGVGFYRRPSGVAELGFWLGQPVVGDRAMPPRRAVR